MGSFSEVSNIEEVKKIIYQELPKLVKQDPEIKNRKILGY